MSIYSHRSCDSSTEAGFSLIEVLVAMTLLSVAASVWLGALMSSSYVLRVETLRAEAVSVAEGLSALRVSLPSRACGSALSSALGGVSVPDDLCAVSSCSVSTCDVVVSRLDGSVLVGGLDEQ